MTIESARHKGPDVRKTVVKHEPTGSTIISTIPDYKGGVTHSFLNVGPRINASSLGDREVTEHTRTPLKKV